MNIKTFVIRSVIGILISIIVYIGLIRYLYLHFSNPKKHLEKYKTILKAPSNDKIVAVLPVSKGNEKKLKPVLNSLLDQTTKIDGIIVHTTSPKQEFSDYVKGITYIAKCGRDYGCAMGVIPALLREDNADTILFILQDDTVYGKDFLQTMLEEIKEKDKPIQSNKALVVKPKYFKPETVKLKETNNTDWIKDYLLVEPIKVDYFENFKRLI